MKDYCTVFQAETAAIKHAAEELITFNNQQITFWSDSLSALQALSNKIYNNTSITDCHKALTKLADENTVQLKCIKAYTGHWGNKKADELTLIPADLSAQRQALSPCGIILTWTSVQVLFYITSKNPQNCQ